MSKFLAQKAGLLIVAILKYFTAHIPRRVEGMPASLGLGPRTASEAKRRLGG